MGYKINKISYVDVKMNHRGFVHRTSIMELENILLDNPFYKTFKVSCIFNMKRPESMYSH